MLSFSQFNPLKKVHGALLLALMIAGLSGFPTPSLADDNVAGKTVYEIRIDKSNLNGFNNAVEGFDVFDLQSWQGMELDRILLEMLIFRVAPVLGGCECDIKFAPDEIHTVHARSIEEVRAGRQLSHPITVFSDDSRVQEGMYLSDPILDADDFFVGFYTHHERNDVLSAKTSAAIENMTFVAASSWEMDNAVLKAIGVKYVNSDNWSSALNQLIAGRADVIMQPFQASDDFSFSEGENRIFKPIPNFKMYFPQGRRYFVSEKHPDGKDFLEALNKGIEVIDGDDEFLIKAHAWAGVTDPRVDDFEVVFPDLTEDDVVIK